MDAGENIKISVNLLQIELQLLFQRYIKQHGYDGESIIYAGDTTELIKDILKVLGNPPDTVLEVNTERWNNIARYYGIPARGLMSAEEFDKQLRDFMGVTSGKDIPLESYRMIMIDADEKEYDVWSEGYSATGEHGTAQFHGKYKASTFKEAVEKMMKEKNWSEENYDADNLTYWGCGFYDNETDARKQFG